MAALDGSPGKRIHLFPGGSRLGCHNAPLFRDAFPRVRYIGAELIRMEPSNDLPRASAKGDHLLSLARPGTAWALGDPFIQLVGGGWGDCLDRPRPDPITLLCHVVGDELHDALVIWPRAL